MSTLVIKNILKMQICDLYENFSTLKTCFQDQYDTIEEIFKIVHKSERNKSEQAGLRILPILERLNNKAPICLIEINNKHIKKLHVSMENRPTLYREDLDICYNLMKQITKNNLKQFSISCQEYHKYFSYLFSYQNQHPDNLELMIEVNDAKNNYHLYSHSKRAQVSHMRRLFSAFGKNISEFKDHFPTRALLAE